MQTSESQKTTRRKFAPLGRGGRPGRETQSVARALQASEKQFRDLFESSPDAIFVEDASGEVLDVNPAACRLHGLTRAELIGRNVADLVPAEQREQVVREFPKWFSGKLSFYAGLSATTKGAAVPVEIRASRIDYRGRPAVVLYVRDISERRRAEEAVRAAERWTEESLTLLRTLQDNAPVGFALVDRRFRFIHVNEALARLSGMAVEDHLGRPVAEVVPGLWRKLQEPLRRAVAHDEAMTGAEISIEPKPAETGERHCLASCYPVSTASGEMIGVGLVVVDITERKRGEERLKRSEESLRALAGHLQTVREEQSRRIAREIHDELGQALTVLKLDLAWVSRQLAEQPLGVGDYRQKLKAMVRQIDGTIRTMRRICTELRPGVLDEIGLVAAIEWQVTEFQRRTGIRCRLSLPAKQLTVDRDRATAVFRIVQEILTNIARHAHATRVRLALEERESQLVLMVRDNGRGIRAVDATSAQSLGMLGMQERATAFGGRVEVRGTRGRGTAIHVWIPLGKVQP